MKKYFTAIIFTLLILPVIIPAGISAQWYLQYESPTHNWISDVRFLDINSGWACGDGMILKTTNGGKEWAVRQIPYSVWQIHPVNDSVVYACGFYVILKTTNGGADWIVVWEGPFPTAAIFYGLWFNDENNGWFCGDRVVMRTTDGGNTFIDSMFVDSELGDIHFKNDSTGCIAAWGYVYRTTNAGVNWNPVPLPYTLAVPFTRKISFQGDTGWTISWGRTVYKTTNYGISWDSIANVPFGNGIRSWSINFSDNNIGYCGGSNGKIFKTYDGGLSWELNYNHGLGAFESIFSYNDSIVWAAGPGIRHTTNGGGILVNISEMNNTMQDYELYQNYPNPFNSSTNIKFKIKKNSYVKLSLYNTAGQEVDIILNKFFNSGVHQINYRADNLPSGIYMYRLDVTGDGISNDTNSKSEHYSETKKLLLIK